ncbi:hypothetical protein KA183_08305 [bacterium]|nr:hypothetical protein [bacterium]QQR56882.1 MAG: hypothetical protein IPG59_18065 [Candidatus Melainabacteria bacterium]
MSTEWYSLVSPETEVTQGDIIFSCPVLDWAGEFDPKSEPDGQLAQMADGIQADVIVLTQACDLMHGKVDTVILCQHHRIQDYRREWKAAMGDKFKAKDWESYCKKIVDGIQPNLFMLNSANLETEKLDYRIVDFHRIYTVPLVFLNSYVKARAVKRPSLLAPYREHLSQSFARFFMRVGLPQNIQRADALSSSLQD